MHVINCFQKVVFRIETTNHCNFKCTFCPHSQTTRTLQYMSDSLFEKIVSQAAALGFKKLDLRNFGEPLLDPDLLGKVRLARQKGFEDIHIFTNAYLLTREKFEALYQAGLNQFYVSFAPRPEFEKTRGPGLYEKVHENLRRIGYSPYREAVSVHYVKSSDLQEDFIRRWREDLENFGLGRVEIIRPHNWAHGNVGVPDRKRCHRLWTSFNVLADGRVSLCCLDYDGETILGDLNDSAVEDVINGPLYQSVRDAHMTGEFPRLCRHCDAFRIEAMIDESLHRPGGTPSEDERRAFSRLAAADPGPGDMEYAEGLGTYAVKSLPGEVIFQNEFLEEPVQRFRTALPPALEVLRGPPRLLLNLKCPSCAHEFTLDYYQREVVDNQPKCPQCGKQSLLSGPLVQKVFEGQLRRLLAEVSGSDEGALRGLGRFIALAAILLEPVFCLMVIGFSAERLGPYLGHTAAFLSAMRGNNHLGRPLLVAFPPEPEKCANHYLTEMWGRSDFVVTLAAKYAYDILRSLIGQSVDSLSINLPTMLWGVENYTRSEFSLVPVQRKPRHARHLADLREPYWSSDSSGKIPARGPYLDFKADELDRAWQWRKHHHLTGPYVAFSGSDPACWPQESPQWNCQDMAVKNFMPAMRWLFKHNLRSVRLGSAEEEFGPPQWLGVLDYPALPRDKLSEFLDIYLHAESVFNVAAPSGANVIPYMGDKPLLLVNCVNLGSAVIRQNGHQIYYCPKKIWSEQEKRFFSLREMFERKMDRWISRDRFQQQEMAVIENTGQEILAAVQEVYARAVTGTWLISPDEERVQKHFQELIHTFYPNLRVNGTLVYSFIKANHFLVSA